MLTRRLRTLYIAGLFGTFFIFVILGLAIFFIHSQLGKPLPVEITEYVDPKNSATIIVTSPNSTQALIFRLFQSIALSAFILISLKWLFSLTRSFFHGALSLLERRHALRFGRLYVYLKKGNELDDQQLIEGFQWNKQTYTSFLDMKPDKMAETLFHKIIDAFSKLPPEVIEAYGKLKNDR